MRRFWIIRRFHASRTLRIDLEEEAMSNCPSDTVRKYTVPVKTGKMGIDVVHDPLYNKGTAFKHIERDRLGLRGLVPPRRLNMRTQLDKLYEIYSEECDPLRKNRFLADLHDRNETLFFRLLTRHIVEMGKRQF